MPHVLCGASVVVALVAVAAAAKLCKKYGATPRGVHQVHLSELISIASLSQPLGPLVRLGYVQSNGAQSWSQTCEVCARFSACTPLPLSASRPCQDRRAVAGLARSK